MRFAVSMLLTIVAVSVLRADDAGVTQSLSITIPHGFPRFAILATIEDNGRSVTIGQPEHFGGTVPHKQSVIEARAYTIGGRRLDPKALHKRLSKDSVVVISTDGHFPSGEYARYLKPRTVVFVFKTSGLFPSLSQQYIHLKLAEEQKAKR